MLSHNIKYTLVILLVIQLVRPKSKRHITQKVINVLLYLNRYKKKAVFKPQCSLSYNSVTTVCKQIVWNRHDVWLYVTS